MLIMKKITAFFIALLVTAMLCSCSEDNLTQESRENTTAQPTTEAVEKPPEELDGYAYSYNHLSDEKTKEIYMGISEKADRRLYFPFKVDGEVTERQINEALNAYKNDHPEVFWLTNKFSYLFENGGTTIYFFFNNNMSSVERVEAKKEFNNTVDKIVANAPKNAGDYEKELYINNYLIDNCTYDKKAAESDEIENNENDAYGALIDKKAVCEGYARAFQLLCNRLGIDCVTVGGTANENHAWNCVKISGEWYQIDPTWNDADNPAARNDYFNLTDEQMYDDHTPAPLYSESTVEDYEISDVQFNIFVPQCTATQYSYYNQSCPVLKNLDDSDDIVNAIAEAASEGCDSFSFLLDESLDYSDTAYQLIYQGYLVDWVDRANGINWYSPTINDSCKVYQNERRRVITIELDYN